MPHNDGFPGHADRRRSPERRRDVTSGGRRISDLESHPHAYITVPAFADHLDVQAKTVKKWIDAGSLPAYQVDGMWRIRKADAIAFIERARFRVRPPTPNTGSENVENQPADRRKPAVEPLSGADPGNETAALSNARKTAVSRPTPGRLDRNEGV